MLLNSTTVAPHLFHLLSSSSCPFPPLLLSTLLNQCRQQFVSALICLCHINYSRLVYLVYIRDGSSDSSPERHQSLGSKAMVNGSQQQPGSWWRELKSSGTWRGRGVGKEKKKVQPVVLMTSYISVFPAPPMILVSHLPWMEIHSSSMAAIHPQYWSTSFIPLLVNAVPVSFEILVYLVFFRDSDNHC